jgi:hypothetical protein
MRLHSPKSNIRCIVVELDTHSVSQMRIFHMELLDVSVND